MTSEDYKATPEQWSLVQHQSERMWPAESCILELRARVEALEEAQEPTVADYFRKLKRHPGVPWAAFLSGAGALAGRDSARGVIVGTLVMSIYWIPVLLTNLEADQ
jgi:hypothetical protein